MSHYRDARAALAGQVAFRRAAAADRAERLAPAVRAMLPAAMREELDALGLAAAREGETLEELAACDAALEALLSKLDQALALAPELRACPDEVPGYPRPEDPEPWLLEEDDALALRRHLDRRLSEHAPPSTLLRWGDRGYVARGAVRGAPFVLSAKLGFREQSFPTAVELALRTSVPDGLGALEVRPERIHHALGKILGLSREVEVGAAPFDDAYWISGDEATATLLSPSVHVGLLTMRPLRAVLTVRGGLVELVWGARADARGVLEPSLAPRVLRYDADALPGAAFDAVLGVRRALEGA